MQKGRPISVVIPIFSQVLKIPLPAVFMPVSEKTEGPFYIWKAVLPGESLQKRSQMLGVMGAKGMTNVLPEMAAQPVVDAYRQKCPDTFSSKPMGIDKIDKSNAYGILFGCGTASTLGNPYSQTQLLIAIQGERDHFLIQWTELGQASKTPIEFDASWAERFKSLMQVRLCPRIPGEPAPYASCLQRAE